MQQIDILHICKVFYVINCITVSNVSLLVAEDRCLIKCLVFKGGKGWNALQEMQEFQFRNWKKLLKDVVTKNDKTGVKQVILQQCYNYIIFRISLFAVSS